LLPVFATLIDQGRQTEQAAGEEDRRALKRQRSVL
jgi:hypothetical protein